LGEKLAVYEEDIDSSVSDTSPIDPVFDIGTEYMWRSIDDRAAWKYL